VDADTPFGINLGIGTVLVVGAVLVAALIPPVDAGWRLGVVAGAVGLFAALTVDQLALLSVALIAWSLVDGFLVNRLGELSWHGSSDIWRLTLLMATGTVGLLVGEAHRHVGAARSRWRFDADLHILVTHVDEEEKCDA
jgi:MFS family permease